jgi:membrane-associated protein
VRNGTVVLSAKPWRVPYPQGMNFSQTVNLFDAHSIISILGLVGILAIIFMETGLLIGLFFPGDSLLFLSGIGASGAAARIFDGVQIEIISLLIAAPIVAIAGSQTGYWIGSKYGVKLFDRPDGRIFNQKKVKATERWLNKYGTGKALVLARFIPFVRTLINPMCGVIKMPVRKFFFWNCVGAVLWTDGLIIAGYYLGEILEGSVDKYLLPVVGLIILVSVIPVGIELLREWRSKRHLS